jgi:general secretion pathway protein G
MRSTELKERRERGFTLVELMVVIIILGLLATVVAPAVMKHLGTAEQTKAKADLQAIDSAIKLYFISNRKVPKMLDLTTPDKKGQSYLQDFEEGQEPKDPWGNPYVIREGDQPGKWEVISWGEDKSPDTEDDLSSKKK